MTYYIQNMVNYSQNLSFANSLFVYISKISQSKAISSIYQTRVKFVLGITSRGGTPAFPHPTPIISPILFECLYELFKAIKDELLLCYIGFCSRENYQILVSTTLETTL